MYSYILIQGFGGHLLSIGDIEEYKWIRNLTSSRKSSGFVAWIGLNDLEQESIWKWSDGTPLSLANWMDLQPNNWGSTDEDCVGMVLTSGKWGDTPCIRKSYYDYMCKIVDHELNLTGTDSVNYGFNEPCVLTTEINPANETVLFGCSCPDGFEKVPQTNTCLKILHKEHRTRHDSAEECQKLGGKLAYFDSQSEYDKLIQWVTVQVSRIRHVHELWIGLIEQSQQSEVQFFGYEENGTFYKTNISNWDSNQPTRARKQDSTDGRGTELEGQHCVQLNPFRRKWKVADCLSIRPALCMAPQQKVIEKGTKVNKPDPRIKLCGGKEWKMWTDVQFNVTYCYFITNEAVSYSDTDVSCSPGDLGMV